MYHKVTPYFPMKQALSTPKCKKIHRLGLSFPTEEKRNTSEE